ncbi:VOC family protein [Amycolatopsis sp. FDAARGOS 1241]|uniref:VOC family protein n=1 Tax=Amycolatopsis sp. FDAARGOS 1241 TaxID=2778070 RepID=UPI00194FC2B5|nr:VOC family protein [Amycolatopsis sp. FDAARGOS 1241]QRP44327.1 VOC family protein [Amycolatopsis sp. FDAARGOS 1241]
MSVGSASASAIPAGLPCWIEVACRDEAVTQQFYTGLFGWEYEVHRDPATPTGRYWISSLAGEPTGGLYQAGAQSAPGWTLHISVPHTASAAEWVEYLGGQVTLGPVAIPDRGSIVHAVDASGAPVVFWEAPPNWRFVTGVPNTFSGADLNAHDGAAADHFYTKLFNYASHQIGDGDAFDYVEYLIEHTPVLYRYVMGSEYSRDTPPHWLVYFEVDPARGTDATAGQALMLGGTVVIQPYDTAYGRMAILADPDGAVFAVIDHSRTLDDIGRAEVDDPYDD